MLISLKMQNFRRHEDKTINFTDGLNVMRAPNEGGKSTTIEAVLYALYGAKILRNALAETVTWGKKEGDLKVELVIRVEGHLFHFTRSKAGAECNHEGGKVTGQTEVSNYAAEILGVDAATATRLMLSNQGNLRGALEEGPKALSQQIEVLANFDLFDTLIERAQAKLLLGPSSMLEGKVAEAAAAAEGAAPVAPNLDEIDVQITDLSDKAQALELDINSTLLPGKAKAQSNLETAQGAQRMHDVMQGNLTAAKEQLDLHTGQQEAAAKGAAVVLDETLIPSLKEQIAGAKTYVKTRADYLDMVRLMAMYPEVSWEGTKEAYLAEVEDVEGTVKHKQECLSSAESDKRQALTAIQHLKGQRVNADHCPACKRQYDNAAEIAATNKEVDEKIKAQEEISAACDTKLFLFKQGVDQFTRELNELKAVAKSAVSFERFIQDHAGQLAVNYEFYPPKLSWKGDEPKGETVDVKGLQLRLAQAEEQQDERRKNAARAEALLASVAEDREQIERLTKQLAECPAPDNVEALEEAVRFFGNQIVYKQDEAAGLRIKAKDLERERQTLQLQYEAAVTRHQEAQKKLTEARKDLEQLNFNNTLLKKIRTARPLIADKLWNTVLASVSTMFSQMRGDKSVVTKEKDGFKVNGQSVESFSGSTLDLLGLAIRVSLVKTFLPHTSFMVLDEVTAACDDDRTVKMLGFLSTCGFDQTLLVTHEDISESFADQLITL